MKYTLLIIISLVIKITPIYSQEIVIDTIPKDRSAGVPIDPESGNCILSENIIINNKEYNQTDAYNYLHDYFRKMVRKDNSITMYLMIDEKLAFHKVVITKIKFPEDLVQIKTSVKSLKISPLKKRCLKEDKWTENLASFAYPIKINK